MSNEKLIESLRKIVLSSDDLDTIIRERIEEYDKKQKTQTQTPFSTDTTDIYAPATPDVKHYSNSGGGSYNNNPADDPLKEAEEKNGNLNNKGEDGVGDGGGGSGNPRIYTPGGSNGGMTSGGGVGGSFGGSGQSGGFSGGNLGYGFGGAFRGQRVSHIRFKNCDDSSNVDLRFDSFVPPDGWEAPNDPPYDDDYEEGYGWYVEGLGPNQPNYATWREAGASKMEGFDAAAHGGNAAQATFKGTATEHNGTTGALISTISGFIIAQWRDSVGLPSYKWRFSITGNTYKSKIFVSRILKRKLSSGEKPLGNPRKKCWPSSTPSQIMIDPSTGTFITSPYDCKSGDKYKNKRKLELCDGRGNRFNVEINSDGGITASNSKGSVRLNNSGTFI